MVITDCSVLYYKCIFDLSPSNAGGESIIETALNFWKAGRDREEIELKDLETVLSLSVFNNKKSQYKANNCRNYSHNKSRFVDEFLISVHRWPVAYKLDWQEPGGLFRPLSASGVPTRHPVHHGRDESKRSCARSACGRPGGTGFSVLPQVREGVCRQRLQDDREQAGLLHVTPVRWTRFISVCNFQRQMTARGSQDDWTQRNLCRGFSALTLWQCGRRLEVPSCFTDKGVIAAFYFTQQWVWEFCSLASFMMTNYVSFVHLFFEVCTPFIWIIGTQAFILFQLPMIFISAELIQYLYTSTAQSWPYSKVSPFTLTHTRMCH